MFALRHLSLRPSPTHLALALDALARSPPQPWLKTLSHPLLAPYPQLQQARSKCLNNWIQSGSCDDQLILHLQDFIKDAPQEQKRKVLNGLVSSGELKLKGCHPFVHSYLQLRNRFLLRREGLLVDEPEATMRMYQQWFQQIMAEGVDMLAKMARDNSLWALMPPICPSLPLSFRRKIATRIRDVLAVIFYAHTQGNFELTPQDFAQILYLAQGYDPGFRTLLFTSLQGLLRQAGSSTLEPLRCMAHFGISQTQTLLRETTLLSEGTQQPLSFQQAFQQFQRCYLLRKLNIVELISQFEYDYMTTLYSSSLKTVIAYLQNHPDSVAALLTPHGYFLSKSGMLQFRPVTSKPSPERYQGLLLLLTDPFIKNEGLNIKLPPAPPLASALAVMAQQMLTYRQTGLVAQGKNATEIEQARLRGSISHQGLRSNLGREPNFVREGSLWLQDLVDGRGLILEDVGSTLLGCGRRDAMGMLRGEYWRDRGVVVSGWKGKLHDIIIHGWVRGRC